MSRRRDGLLTTESKRDFARRRKRLFEQIGPMGMVEQEYADSFVHDRWEIERYREISAGVLNNAFVEALENVLKQALPRDKYESALDLNHDAEDLARRYFQDSGAKAEVSSLLRQSGLNETSIEAEAFRLCAADLEAINRIIQFKQDRSDNDLGLLAAIRQGGLACLQAEGDATNEDEVPRLIDVKDRA